MLLYDLSMLTFLDPPAAVFHSLLQDARQRDLVTARRSELLSTLWLERYLTREQLIARLEMRLGINCFGIKAWEDNFYRDMRFVKSAFSQAGYDLKYSRSSEFPGYYLSGEGLLHEEIKRAIQGAMAELDDRQIAIYQHLTPAQKFSQAASIINFGKKVAERIR